MGSVKHVIHLLVMEDQGKWDVYIECPTSTHPSQKKNCLHILRFFWDVLVFQICECVTRQNHTTWNVGKQQSLREPTAGWNGESIL